ncbi:BnaC01g29780D [Brassica napus]|uniref:BnaC01g29780D protein n=2 Tax=Brassica TaxID=3705 RepID=A0A078GJ60_BRANA|nr:BnaC01g29780D [Brassica napus]VDD51454.1 unnamed protein product [Brassica oleracea]
MAWWLITRERLRHQLSKNFIWKVDHDAVASIFSRSPLSNSQPLLTDADASQDNMDIKNQISDHQFLISTEDQNLLQRLRSFWVSGKRGFVGASKMVW